LHIANEGHPEKEIGMGREPAEILIFAVAGRHFGLPVEAVREILPAVSLTPVPGMPSLEGIFNLRGQVVPVVDFRKRMGLPSKDLEPADHLLVISAASRVAALRVDRALKLTRLEKGAVEALHSLADAPGSPDEKAAMALGQVAKIPEGLVLLQDVATWLAQPLLPELGGLQVGETISQPRTKGPS
jgi:purine-binding chemotaxis protein CheW